MAPATATHGVEFHQLVIDQLTPWSKNPRKHRNTVDDAELVDNVRQNGIIEPLIARPTLKAEVFEIIAGERRFTAAKAAGLTRLPVVVRELDDDQALHFALSENGHRNNLHPLDEAAAFAELQRINPGVNTIEHLAAQHGRSVRYVKESLQLLQLAPAALKAFEAGEITLTHARKIAKLDPKLQPKALGACFQDEFDYDTGKRIHVLAPVKNLDAFIAHNVRLDLSAPETQEEFPELVADVTQARAEGATVLMLSDNYGYGGKKPGPNDPLPHNQWDEAHAKAKGAVMGVIVEGRRRGKVLHVTLAKDRPTAPLIKAKASNKKPTAAERDQAKQVKAAEVKKLAAARAKEARQELVTVRAIAAVAEKTSALKGHALLLAVAESMIGGETFDDALLEKLAPLVKVPREVFRWGSSGARLRQRMTERQLVTLITVLALGHDDALAAICKSVGVDLKKIDAQIAKEQAALEAERNIQGGAIVQKMRGVGVPKAAKKGKGR